MSYLICTKCKRYYKLQPGEYPEDFMDRCACGGKLIYSDTNLLSSKKTHGPKNIIIHLVIIIAITFLLFYSVPFQNVNSSAAVTSIGQQEAQVADVQGQSDPKVLTQVNYGDCWADSMWLYDQLTGAGIPVRIMSYVDRGYGAGYRHTWVEINTGNVWKSWDYTGFNSHHYGDVGDGTPFVLIGPGNETANILGTGY
jgi:hypothetical protein